MRSKNELVEPAEKTLFFILAALATVIWAVLIVGTLGIALIYIFFFWVFGLYAQSYLISYLVGTGAVVTEKQFPDLHKYYEECCNELGMEKRPTMILIQMDGMFNAFATRFLRKHYVVLLSDVVDALQDEPEAIKFYIGHELGHVSRNHIMRGFYLFPVFWVPLLNSAYSRACELTCDRHGLACCDTEDSAVKAMSALAVGGERWKTMSTDAYLEQKSYTRGFWMSLHEIFARYPWLVRRIARLHKDPEKRSMPRRNIFAWIVALIIPAMLIAYMVSIVIFLVDGGMQNAMLDLMAAGNQGSAAPWAQDTPYQPYQYEYDPYQ